MKEIHCYNSVGGIIAAIKDETGKSLDDMREKKGLYRQIARAEIMGSGLEI